MTQIYIAAHRGMVARAILRRLEARDAAGEAYDLVTRPHAELDVTSRDFMQAENAVAKIAGIKLCESDNRQHGTDCRSVMPTNLYGSGNHLHPQNSHAMPALIRRDHEAAQTSAEEVVIWGSSKPMRAFLHVDDMAAASVFGLDLDEAEYAANPEPMLSHINVGTGTDVTILELARKASAATGFKGRIAPAPASTMAQCAN